MGDGAAASAAGEQAGWTSEALQLAALVGSVATPVGYVIGRLATDTFFGRLGVSSEEVGISQLTLVLSSALAAIVLACVAVLATLLGSALRRGWPFILGFGALLTLVEGEISWRGLLAGVLLAAALAAFGGEGNIVLSPAASRRVAMLGLVLVGLTVGALAIVQANWRADDALAGRATQVSLGPVRMQGVRAQPVTVDVIGHPAGLSTLDGRCALLLGANDDTVVLLTGGTVWRTPATTTVLHTTPNHCER